MSNTPRIGCLIPIRLASERLPGKALLQAAGKPMVHHLLDRVFACRHIAERKDVVVCTTTEASDDPLVPAVEGYGASVFRGSRDDIIDRFHAAVGRFGFDIVLEVDGDDPFCDSEYMDLCIGALLDDPTLGVVICGGLPLGIAPKAFTRDALQTVFDSYKTTENDTGFMYLFTKTGLCRQAEITPVSPDHVHETARLTLDYEVDRACFTAIIDALQRQDRLFTLAEIVDLLKRRPEILALNSGLSEEYDRRTQEKALLSYVDPQGQERQIDLTR